jgi:hypothetical protein
MKVSSGVVGFAGKLEYAMSESRLPLLVGIFKNNVHSTAPHRLQRILAHHLYLIMCTRRTGPSWRDSYIIQKATRQQNTDMKTRCLAYGCIY